MKKVLVVLLTVFSLSASAGAGLTFAQGNSEAGKTSDVVSRKMMQHLKLNELEYIKVKELNQARIAKISAVVEQHSNNPSMQESLCAEIEKEFETKLASILVKEKMEFYAAFKLTPEGDVLALLKNSSDKAPAAVK